MKIFSSADIREIDAFTIKNEPVTSDGLMERAARSCGGWISKNYTREHELLIFTGPGNNGGDGWAIARLMAEAGYRVQLYNLFTGTGISEDAALNKNRLIDQGLVKITDIGSEKDFPVVSKNQVIVDALFGSGLGRPLTGLAGALVSYINSIKCTVISIDVPSGLFGEDNRNNNGSIIEATHTLTFEFPRRAFFFAENEKYTGICHILRIGLHPEIIQSKETAFYYTVGPDITIKKRTVFSHKGLNGHGLLIAGSYGMTGAAILSARACMRSGIGLLTTHLPAACYPIVQGVVPESVFSIDRNNLCFSEVPETNKFSAIGIGPGIGTHPETVTALEYLLKNCNKPLVIDADAINILAANPEMKGFLPPGTILTPHPGEFDRLTGHSSSGFERNEKQIEFSKKYSVVVILKGAYTSTTLGNGKCLYNSTGNPGMATAGSGDVLTGIILSLLAQGYTADDAAITGTYLHGLAGDMAAEKFGQHALIASDIIENTGNAIKQIIEK